MPWLENVIVRLLLTSQTLDEQFQKDWSNMMADWKVFTFGEASDGQYSFSIDIPDDGMEVDGGRWKIRPQPPLEVSTCS